MPFYRVGDVGLLFGATAALAVDLAASPSSPPPPPPPDGLSPAWLVEYVDTSGVRQRTSINNDGSTAITIRQYANVTFDARDSRSTSSDCDTDWGAAQLLGYGVNYGEALGGTWATSGLSNDVDHGPPIFNRCYSVTGSRTVSLHVKDPDGREATTTLTINVEAIATPVDISSGGSWPTWEDNGVYGLTAGGNYSSRGTINLSGRTGVRIIKTGSGADPVVAQFRPEARGVDHGSVITDRSKDCVLVNIDYASFAEGLIGVDYCGSFGGRCRHFGTGEAEPKEFYWDNAAIATANTVNAANIKRSRGIFIVNGGPIDGGASTAEYCLIGGSRYMNFAGTVFARTTGGTNGNPLRTYMDSTVLRHVQVYSTTATFGHFKGSLFSNVYQATPTDDWPDDDSFGDYATSRALYLANGDSGQGFWGLGPKYFWVVDSVFGGPGSYSPTFIGGWNPQNNLAPSNGTTGPWLRDDCYESADIGGFERNRLTYNTSGQLTLGGRNLSYRSNTQFSGAEWSVSLNANGDRVHPDYRGPYINSTRPVPTPFED